MDKQQINNAKVIKEQLEIVQDYMNNMESYRLNNGEYWENLKKLKLKNKDEEYIEQVNKLIDEWIIYGEKKFYEKYKLK